MKKIIALALMFMMVFSISALAESEEELLQVDTEAETEEVKGEGVMTYDEFTAASVDDEVVIEAYIQAKQAWEDDTASIYLQDYSGGYFVYALPCSEDEYGELAEGTKVKVTGYKAMWPEEDGEVEISDAIFEIEDGEYISEPVDVTEYLADSDTLSNYMNMRVSFTGMTVEASGEDSDQAYLYNWDGSGSEGDDLYFNVSLDEKTYSFVVESDLCDADSDVYKAVEALNVGDVIDMEGFLYWYEGPNPHITSVSSSE